MNANQLISMIVRLVMRKLVSRGIDAGLGAASRRGGGAKPGSPEDAERSRAAKQTAKRARQASKLTRRLGRF